MYVIEETSTGDALYYNSTLAEPWSMIEAEAEIYTSEEDAENERKKIGLGVVRKIERK